MLKAKDLKANYIRIIVWVMFGVITSMIIACMLLVGSVNIDKFYDVGECYDYFSSHIGSSGVNEEYNSETHIFTVTAEEPRNVIVLKTESREWKYMYFDVIEAGKSGKIDAMIDYYAETDADTATASQKISLYTGENEIAVPNGISFNKMIVSYDLEIGDYYGIDNIEFMESQKPFTAFVLIKKSILIFWGYVILSIIVIAVRRAFHVHLELNWYGPIELLQRLFCIVGDSCGKHVLYIGEKKRDIIRKILFAGLFLYMQVAKNLGWYHTKSTYNYQLVVAAFFIILIALLCYEKKTRLCNWKKPLVGAWFALWTMACISDFLVPKRYAWVGYIMIFAMGFLFFMWNNMKDKMIIIHDITDAVMGCFIVNAIFCFLCRPETDGVRYAGGYFNPVTFGMDLAIVCVVWIYKLDCKIRKGDKLYTFLPLILAGDVAMILLWKTQSATGIFVIPVCILIFVIQQIRFRRKPIRILAGIAMCVFLLVPVYVGADWCLHNLPYKCNTVVTFERDIVVKRQDTPYSWGNTVFAAGTSEQSAIQSNRIIRKLVNSSWTDRLAGRNYFWKAYLRETNLLGHKSKGLTLWGIEAQKPHSGFLMILYRYGAYAMIPYILMIGMNLAGAFRVFYEKEKDGLLLLMIALSVGLHLFVENIEYAFLGLDWFLLYLLMGQQFMGKVAEECDGRAIDKKIE